MKLVCIHNGESNQQGWKVKKKEEEEETDEIMTYRMIKQGRTEEHASKIEQETTNANHQRCDGRLLGNQFVCC